LPFVILSVGLLAATGCADEPRVGVVDVQEAFQHSPLAMVAALQLKGEVGSAQRDIKKRGRAIADLLKQVRHGDHELSVEQREEIEQRIAQETAQLTKLQVEYRADLAAAQQRQGQEMIAKVEDVAREVARQEGLAVLVRSDDVLYAAKDADVARIDITEQVIRALLDKINPTEIPEPPENPN
jgi:Skp family chaperone for outer membrane proteins